MRNAQKFFSLRIAHFAFLIAFLSRSFVVVSEVTFDLLKRTSFCFGNKFNHEQQAQKSDAREDKERRAETEAEKQLREEESDKEVGDPQAQDRATHAHAAKSDGEQLGEQKPRDRRQETLLEEKERDS